MTSAYQTKTNNEAAVREDIGGLMAELASRPQVNQGTAQAHRARSARPC